MGELVKDLTDRNSSPGHTNKACPSRDLLSDKSEPPQCRTSVESPETGRRRTERERDRKREKERKREEERHT